jgi:sec-independent protein translocase protein TatA
MPVSRFTIRAGSRTARQGPAPAREERHMPRLGLPELMIIFLIVIVIFGANRLPQLGRGIGSAIKNFKEGIRDSDDTAEHKS